MLRSEQFLQASKLQQQLPPFAAFNNPADPGFETEVAHAFAESSSVLC